MVADCCLSERAAVKKRRRSAVKMLKPIDAAFRPMYSISAHEDIVLAALITARGALVREGYVGMSPCIVKIDDALRSLKYGQIKPTE